MERFRNNAALLLASNRDNEIIQRFVKINEAICEQERKAEEEKPLVSIIKKGSGILSKQQSKLTVTFAKLEENSEVQKTTEDDDLDKRDADGRRRKSSLEDLATAERRPSVGRDRSSVEVELVDEIAKKKKKRKKKPSIREEEMYTDKDRAAAAAMGSRDIKQSLKMKKKMDRSRMLQIPEEAQPGNFLALANYEMQKRDVERALDCINKALELNPEEKNALVARSKCYILLGQPDKALQDAEKALTIDKKFVKALYQKAEALYYLGHFEHSLMYYHRGLKIRPDHEGFQLGIKKTQKAIKNAIGSGMHTSNRKTSSSSISKLRAKEGSKSTSKTSTPTSKASSSAKDNGKNDHQQQQQQYVKETNSKCSSSKSSRKVSSPSIKVNYKPDTGNSRVLRELRVDKDYLDKLLNNPDIRNADNGNSPILAYIKDAVDFLNSRQEFWRQQSPYHPPIKNK